MEKSNLPFGKLKDLLAQNSPESCSICGGQLSIENVKLDQLEKQKLYVIEDVPAYVCTECGEIWIPKPILDELDKMIELTTKHKQKKHKIIRKGKSVRKRGKKNV